MDINPVKAKLAQNLPSLGTWSASGDPTVIETLLHTTDLDWVTLDFEHNPIDVSTAVHCLRAGNGSGKPIFARIPNNDPIWVKRVLDIGFTGIVVPDVKDEEEAELAVSAAKYRPRGLRGIGSTRGQLVYGSDYYTKANELMMVICMIEDWRAVDRIDQIMQVPDLDVCFVGPNDLASSLGVPTGLDNRHPDHVKAVETVVAAGKKHGVATGIHCIDGNEASRRIEQGMTWFPIASDVRLLKSAVDAELASVASSSSDDADSEEDASFY